jgi:hypothetical protein
MTHPNESAHPATRRISLAAGVLAGVMAAAVLGACEGGPPLGPDRAAPERPLLTLNPVCAGSGGQTHTDSITSSATWGPAGNPHRVNQLIHIEGAGSLRLAAGALVCFGSGGGLRADNGGRLRVVGTSLAPVVLTAADLADGWLGVRLAGTPTASSPIRNLRLEHTQTEYALATHDNHTAAIDSAVFRQNEFGVYLWGRGSSLRRSFVDTVTNTGSAAVTMGGKTTFQQTAIRGAAGVGLAVLGTDSISLVGGRIEGSGGVGLRVTTPASGLLATQPVRVTGGAGYPAEMEPDVFARLYIMLAYQDSLLGNALDLLLVPGGTLMTTVHVGPTLPWRVMGHLTVQGHLVVLPGATLTFDVVRLHMKNGGRLSARGTPAARVRFTGGMGMWFGEIGQPGTGQSTSYLTNALIEETQGVAVLTWGWSHRVVIDSTVFRQTGHAAWFMSGNSRISRSRVDTTTGMGGPAVLLGDSAILESTLIRGSAQQGLLVSWAATVQGCEIRDSAAEGIELSADSSQVHDCNLVNNGGDGIRASLASYSANVEDNWWGDEAGPTGPGGDGVSAGLDYTPWRTTPYVLPYVP